MRLIEKLFKGKKGIEQFIEDSGRYTKGVEAAVKEFGIEKLVMFKILQQYEGTNLYYTDYAMVDRVYNKEGEHLGLITVLMSPYYKKLGYFYGPCKNGNIILSQIDEEKSIRTYGVFDKDGKVVIPYNKYYHCEFLENGVALMGLKDELNSEMITIHYDGTVKTQPFVYIDRDYSVGGYILSKVTEDGIEEFSASDKIVNLMMDKSTEIGSIEKGIE